MEWLLLVRRSPRVHSSWSLAACGRALPSEVSCSNCSDLYAIFSFLSGYKSRDSVPKLVEDYLSGYLKLDPFVTHHRPLEKINETFDMMHAGER